MQGNRFTLSFHIPGTLAADLNVRWKAPAPCTLAHVSAVGSNAAAAGLNMGSSADTDGYLAKYSIGASNAPVEKEALADFDGALAGGQFPRLADGDVLVLELDYDYNGGGAATASADVTIVLTLEEG